MKSKQTKSNFERLLDILTPQQRAEMIQRGLNPFNEDHVNQYIETFKETKYNFIQRIKIASSYIFKGIINDQLKQIIIKEITSDLDKLLINSDKYEGEFNPNTSPLIEKMIKKEPNLGFKNDEKYKQELTNIIEKKIKEHQSTTQPTKKTRGRPRKKKKNM